MDPQPSSETTSAFDLLINQIKWILQSVKLNMCMLRKMNGCVTFKDEGFKIVAILVYTNWDILHFFKVVKLFIDIITRQKCLFLAYPVT